MSVEVQFLTHGGGEVCCGSPLLRAGFSKTAKALAKQNVAVIEQSQVREIITTCPGCARALRQDYPQLGTPLPKGVKIWHITELLAQKRKKLGALLTDPWQNGILAANPVMTYHDPCHLSRDLGVYEQPRQILNLIPGGKFIEFSHNSDHADCCGGGGALPKTFPELATAITDTRLDAGKDTSASYLVTACPNCKLHFTETQNASGDRALMVLDIMELLKNALRVQKRER